MLKEKKLKGKKTKLWLIFGTRIYANIGVCDHYKHHQVEIAHMRTIAHDNVFFSSLFQITKWK